MVPFFSFPFLCCHLQSFSPFAHSPPLTLYLSNSESVFLSEVDSADRETEIETSVWNTERIKAGSSLFPPSVVLSDTTFIIFYCSKHCLSLDPDFSRLWHDRTKGRGWTDRRVHREGEEGLGETEKGRGKKDGNDIRTVYVRRPHSISHLLFASSVSLFFTDLITLQKTKAITNPTLLMS